MKTKSKALLTTLCAVLLVAASVLGTMAYLTDHQTVTNTFTVGKISITLDEAKVNLDGQPLNEKGEVVTNVANAHRQTTNDYKLMPGKTYTKDPTVHVTANSEDAYIFVKVENGIADYEAEGNKIAKQIADNKWTALENNPGVYYKEYTKNAARQDLVVFENFKIADNANTTAGWGNINAEKTKVTVTAYAIQKDGFENDLAGAWEAVTNASK